MNTIKAQPGVWSIRCYRWLLWLYPASFIAELGDSVEQIFRDMLRDAYQKRGYPGIALLWFRIVPDFIFSAFELLTSTAGDYLRWYFRLRWVLACALGFGAGALTALALKTAGFFDYMGLSPMMGLAGFCVWVFLGFFQSHVLTSRFCHRHRWVGLTVLGGVLGTLGSALLLNALSLSPIGPYVPGKWGIWALHPLLAVQPALVCLSIGLFQRYAFRQRNAGTSRWAFASTLGGAFSGLLALPVSSVVGLTAWIGVDAVMGQVLQNAAVGALFGIMTAGPLKWTLWREAVPLPSGEGGAKRRVRDLDSAASRSADNN